MDQSDVHQAIPPAHSVHFPLQTLDIKTTATTRLSYADVMVRMLADTINILTINKFLLETPTTQLYYPDGY